MIDAGRLLADLQRLLKTIENDLRGRCADNPDVDARVRAEYNEAKSASRTSQAYEVWRDEFITQVAAAWTLACVFVRFIEDNRMLDEPGTARAWLAGPGERLRLARDRHTLYFREHPTESDREYLEHVFRAAANPTGRRTVPVVRALFDEEHNPLWRLGVSGDGATALLNFWQQVEPETGEPRHDFTDAEWNTRFLGDLYQDLSEAARKKYALLQTPEFVEEFILDRTLGPAVDEFGYQAVRLIDPTCGSGHFLLGAFGRLFDLYARNEPGVNAPELARRALGQVYGVDLNPFAVAIARFRLLVAAMKASNVERLQDAPGFEFNLAVGDSLLHGPPRGGGGDQLHMMWSPLAHVYAVEDKEQLDRILVPGRYHAVVGNPPYITVKDSALNQEYRTRFGSSHRKYSLAVPFMERFFDLAVKSGNGEGAAGRVGMITANSFMKREFGKKLIEQYIPRWDLTHVIDTAGAYIPGHGTPTVILFGRNRRPVSETIRAVMGIKGEPGAPPDPARGRVWTSIVGRVDLPGTQDEFVSVADTARASFHRHPWNIGGGGIAELKEQIDEAAESMLGDVAESVGFGSIIAEDEAFTSPPQSPRLRDLPVELRRPFIDGESVRDWFARSSAEVLFPYTTDVRLRDEDVIKDWLWELRTVLWARPDFSRQTYRRCGRTFWEYHQIPRDRNRRPLNISFSNVATHNHFVLVRGGKVFNSHAPLISLPDDSSEAEHLELLGVLNSSLGCFWIKQVSHNKGSTVDQRGARQRTMPFEDFYELDGTKLKRFPLPGRKPLDLARAIDRLAQQRHELLPGELARRQTPALADWQRAETDARQALSQMIALQEELDWQCYKLYGVLDEALTVFPREVPPINLGERAFEIVLARKMAAGELQTTWFERHGSTPTTEIPARWPEEYRRLVGRRIEAVERNANVRLIEQPEYKRRWNTEPWDSQAERALREWLLNRLEDPRYWSNIELTTTARLADRVRSDQDFMRVAEMYRGRSDFDVANLVAELVKTEAVPFLPVLRYKPSGLRNRQVWEQTWASQRREDAIDARTRLPTGDPQRINEAEAARLKAEQVGDINVPPKYKSADFLEQTFWRLRGKLDVPKERFVSYPRCERDADPTLPIAWAGWDHLEQARALAAYYEQMKTNEGWGVARLVPLLNGILELLPWLEQWHNEVDPTYGTRMGEFFQGFVEEEARAHGLTLNKIREWSPSV
ncbi:MAG TPA: BREX-2 system adenine-specific DNA-methyltransferase PglX [Pyrinomonadaceae bacterium]